MKIRQVGSETDGRVDRYNEANSRFSQFCNEPKNLSNGYMLYNINYV